jgi:hypothetical protein
MGAAQYTKEPLGQLFQPLISVLTRFGQYPLYYWAEPWLPPVVPGCRLRTGRVTQVGTLKQGACCRVIEPRIIAVRERKSRRRIPAPCILIYKRPRHSSVYSKLARRNQPRNRPACGKHAGRFPEARVS